MSSASSGSRPSNKILQEPELSSVFIKKPHTLSESCPVETTAQRLPLIEERCQVKKKVTKSSESFSGSTDSWLKPGISLPKLKPEKVPQTIEIHKEDANDSLKSVDFKSFSRLKILIPDDEKSHSEALSKVLTCFKNIQEAEVEDREIFGPSECQSEFRVPASELNFDEFQIKEEEMEESHALRRWEYWLEQHKILQNYLCKRLKRDKRDLQFQKAQNYRKVVEDKSLLFIAQMPVADKWRGHPFLWKPALKIGGVKSKVLDDESPEYFGVKTKLENGEVPEVELIGVPEVIKKEKNLVIDDTTKNESKNGAKLPYRQFRSRNWRHGASNVIPHDAEMDNLEVVGKKIWPKNEEKVSTPVTTENIPRIRVSEIKNEEICSKNFYADRGSVFWLSIGDKELQYEIGNEYSQNVNNNEVDLNWQIDFGVNPVGVLTEKTLKVENKGTMTVKYKFFSQNRNTTQSFSSLPCKQHEPWFFFNKNSGIFLPGQVYNLKFYTYAKRSGFRKEIWYLSTNPPLLKNVENGTIVFWAVSTEEYPDQNVEALDAYLRKRMTLSVVDFILQILISKVLSPCENLRDIEYRSLFMEKELFEYQNTKHFYHSDGLKKLHEYFEQIPDKKQKEWDLSISSLTQLVTMNIKGKDQDSLLRQIAENARKLFKPNFLLINNIKQYRMTYEILCKMTNFMEEDYENVKNCFFERKNGSETSFFESVTDEERNVSNAFSEEENGEEENGLKNGEETFKIKPIDFLFFQHMFYLKVYQRVSEAIEHMAGVLETSKLSKPLRNVYKREKME